MTEQTPETHQSPITDQEIDALIRDVLLSDTPGVAPPSQSGGQLSALWYLAVFLLGMTAMEGLRLMIPTLQEVRGELLHRCGGLEMPNPADPETVAWTPE